MGKKVKDVAKKVGRGASAVYTLGGSEIARNNLSKDNVINKVLQAPGTILTGGLSASDDLGEGEGEGGPAGGDYARLDALLRKTSAQGGIDQEMINKFGEEQAKSAGATNAEALALRKTRRGELASLLSQQANNEFQLSQPEIAEASNAGGVLYSSGYGTALAKEKGRIGQERDLKLAQQALSDTDADIEGMQQVGAIGRGSKEAGLSRRFSLEDMSRQGSMSREIGASMPAGTTAAAAPSGGGKGGMMNGAAGGAAAGAPMGPWGAAIGGGIGGILGASKKKGK